MLKNTLKKLINNKQTADQKTNQKLPKLKPIKKLPHSFLFVHIPKTAGTSFRKSAEELYPTLGDYGDKSLHTSELIQEHCYKQPDMYSLKRAFDDENQILSGHFLSQKYLDFVDTRRILSFVRDPLEQVISHYNHCVTHLDYEGDFETFIKLPRYCNVQSRYLSALPVSLLGFVGLTDKYDESLAFINQKFGLDIAFKQDNVGLEKTQAKETLTAEQCEIITTNNSLDIILVNQVKALFEQRITCKNNNLAWIHSCGHINPNNILVGCAYYEQREEAVELELIINNKIVKQFYADQFTGLYPKVKFPRARYVGFHVNLNDFEHVMQVQLKVRETEQIVFEQKFSNNN